MTGRRKNVKLRKRRNMLKVQDEMVWKIMKMEDRIGKKKEAHDEIYFILHSAACFQKLERN